MTKKSGERVIEIDIHFREGNCSHQDYNSVALAWLKGQSVFRDTLKQLADQDLLSPNIAWNLFKEFGMSDIDNKLEKLRLFHHSSNLIDSNSSLLAQTASLPLGKTILPSFTKDALKEKIVQLAKNQEQPNFNFDVLIDTTNELINHPDLMEDEKYRYGIYYRELLDFRNYKQFGNFNQTHREQTHAFFSHSTSISQVRNEMVNQLQKIRET